MESLQQQILTDEREQHQATITFVLVKIAHLKADTETLLHMKLKFTALVQSS